MTHNANGGGDGSAPRRDHATAPLPPILRSLVQIHIHAARHKDTWRWVALLSDLVYPPVLWEERLRLKPQLDSWLSLRFGSAAVLGDKTDLEAKARQTLALLLAEGEAPRWPAAVIAAQDRCTQLAPDLPLALPVRGPSRLHPISSSGVREVQKARATLSKLQRLNRKARTAATQESAVPEYIYAHRPGYDFDGNWMPASHHRWRILRETKRFLFVDPGDQMICHGDENWSGCASYCDGLGRGSVRLPRELSHVDWAARERMSPTRTRAR
ncbi:MAG: hypothetical protein RLZZ515_2216, partial [Cyanobacteriota bacterium]